MASIDVWGLVQKRGCSVTGAVFSAMNGEHLDTDSTMKYCRHRWWVIDIHSQASGLMFDAKPVLALYYRPPLPNDPCTC